MNWQKKKKGRKAMLNRSQILEATDLGFEEMEVPEWGGSVRVRTMTGAERDAFESEIYEMKGESVKFNRENFRARLLVRTIADEKNDRLFSDADIAVLGKKSARVLDRLFAIAQKLNGISAADREEMVKNSSGEDGASSSSTSPVNLG
jgi:hypothetical protein